MRTKQSDSALPTPHPGPDASKHAGVWLSGALLEVKGTRGKWEMWLGDRLLRMLCAWNVRRVSILEDARAVGAARSRRGMVREAWMVARRVKLAVAALEYYEIEASAVHVSVYADGADDRRLFEAAIEVRQAVGLAVPGMSDVSAYVEEVYAKPGGGLVLASGVEMVFGSSREDYAAARAAKVQFLWA